MKRKIVAIVLFLLIMALLPPVAVKCSGLKSDLGQTFDVEETDDSEKVFDSDELLCKLTSELYKDDYCDEALKAIVILLRTDLLADKSKFDINGEDFGFAEDDNSDKELSSKIKGVINSSKELITLDGKAEYIPYCEASSGATADSEEYTYLCSVASPWDCYCQSYDPTADCVGVSLSGVNYLCQNGASAEEALKWYLPYLEISEGQD